jgi:predicted AlkP superfamily phosphohydrolase/phosphomutase
VRVVALGLDSAERSYVESLMSAGEMPALASLVARSRRLVLDAAQARNEYVWAEFVRGRDPGAQHEWDTHRFDPASYDAYLLHARPGTRWWHGAADGRVVTLDVPQVTAVEPGDGVHVVGWGAAQVYGPRSSSPRGLLREIDARFGPHPMVRNDQMGWHHARRIDDVTAAMARGARQRAHVARFLLDRYDDWQLFATVWSEMHPAAEFLWHGVDDTHLLASHPTAALAGDALRRVFHAVDDGIGELVDALPADVAVVVFSLNGVQTGPGDTPSGALLPEFLSRLYAGEGVLDAGDAAAWRQQGCPPVVPGPCQRNGYFSARRTNGDPRVRVAQRVLEALPAAAWPAQHAARRVVARVLGKRVGPAGMTIPPEVDVDAGVLESTRIQFGQVADWYHAQRSTMPAFALPSFAHGYVRVNLAGRERDGVVDPGDYRRVTDELAAVLRTCTSPRTGRPVVRDVVRTRGDTVAAALDPDGPYADLIVVWEPCVDAFEHPGTGLVGPFPLQRVAGHSRNGFALVCAPGLLPGDGGRQNAVALTGVLRSLLARPPLPGSYIDLRETRRSTATPGVEPELPIS